MRKKANPSLAGHRRSRAERARPGSLLSGSVAIASNICSGVASSLVIPSSLTVNATPMGYILAMASESGHEDRDIRFTAPLYTLTEAARYLGVRPETFVTWAEGYERRHPDRPAVKKGPMVTAFPGRRGAPRVPFIGLSEAMVLVAFRRSGLPMQRIRPAVRILQEQIGLEHALASKKLYSDVQKSSTTSPSVTTRMRSAHL
jgi:helix-turn-helix protein